MLSLAFSTVACPNWPYHRIADAAARYGYTGVEMRSLGLGGGPHNSAFACDPGLSDPAKVRSVFAREGVDILGLATGLRFDEVIQPPVVGHLLGVDERLIREGCAMVDLAASLGADTVRIFPLEKCPREKRSSALRRITDRVARLAAHARHRDLTIVVENAGSFRTAADLAEIIDRINMPQVRACYDLAAANSAGDDPVAGVRMLGPRLRVARVRDTRAGLPCLLALGELPCEAFVRAVTSTAAAHRLDVDVTFTWDKAWLPEIPAADDALPHAAALLSEWTSGARTLAASA